MAKSSPKNKIISQKKIPQAQLNKLDTLFKMGKYAELENLAHTLTEKFPDSAAAWQGLGIALRIQAKPALQAMEMVVALSPDDAIAYFNLGNAYQDLGEQENARKSYLQALDLDPKLAEAHHNLGCILADLSEYQHAIEAYQRALLLRPNFAEAEYNLAHALQDIGQLDLAVKHYCQSIKLNPRFVDAYYNLGHVLLQLNQFDNAIEALNLALSYNPNNPDAHASLGLVLNDVGRYDEALKSRLRALELVPNVFEYAMYAALMLPAIFSSLADLISWRERYVSGVSDLLKKDFSGNNHSNVFLANPLSFYLAYHNFNDRNVMQALCKLFRHRQPQLTTSLDVRKNYTFPSLSVRKIKIGFVSQFLVGHTIGKLYQGFIKNLDRNIFEVVVVHTCLSKQDELRKLIDSTVDSAITLPANLPEQQNILLAEKFDILFYPDIGMSAITYTLAFSRLAPVQVVSWGHPDTTGLDSIDYFLSAKLIEPENAEEHYSERLICLNRIPCFYNPIVAPTQVPTRSAMGLPEQGILYGCPQSLFKFHPDFDAILLEILQGDPSGHLILLEGGHSSWAEQLKIRWAKSAPLLLERAIFLPRMPLKYFMALNIHIDILLDPIHFGSGNTLYESMVYGTPIVTWPGQFMRGRIVAGAYQQMGIVNAPVAECLEDYASLALALARDPDRRIELRQQLRDAAVVELFADQLAVKELEQFFIAAVDAASRNEILPVGWHPAPIVHSIL